MTKPASSLVRILRFNTKPEELEGCEGYLCDIAEDGVLKDRLWVRVRPQPGDDPDDAAFTSDYQLFEGEFEIIETLGMTVYQEG